MTYNQSYAVRAEAPEVIETEDELVERIFDEATGPRSPLTPQQRGILLLRIRCAMSVQDVCLALSILPSNYARLMKEAEDTLKAMLAQYQQAGLAR